MSGQRSIKNVLPQGLLLNTRRNAVVRVGRDRTVRHADANFRSEAAFLN